MNIGGSLDSIPIDLVFEIFSRLPAKSVARFHCVSKLWASMLARPSFTELFLTRSSARPRLLFLVYRNRELSFYSSPQSQNMYGKSSSVVAAEFHTKLSLADDMWPEFRGPTSGLVYFPSMPISKEGGDTVPVILICNPITGQYTTLPKPRKSYILLGFDPIDKQFKVLSMPYPLSDDDHQILTVGTGEMRWRTIQCPLKHVPSSERICINGVLYYITKPIGVQSVWMIVCFDVRSEKFKFIVAQGLDHWFTNLINYKGKLGVISWKSADNSIELLVAVLEDVEKHEWSKYVYTLPENKFFDRKKVLVGGMTTTGEIVFYHTYEPFYVFYFNPERNTLQSVEIQGLENHSSIRAFVNHVEDLNVNDANLLKSSKGINIVRKRPKPERSP